MNLEKLFGSKAKVDILKYLLFKRQWLSMRALESELTRTFPAIKKQIDSLYEAEIINIDKNDTKRAIRIQDHCHDHIKNLFLHNIKQWLTKLFLENEEIINKYYRWNRFGNNIDMDLIILYKDNKEDNNNKQEKTINKIKEEISNIFSNNFIEIVSVVFMSSTERDKRHRLADRFVLNIMKNIKTTS